MQFPNVGGFRHPVVLYDGLKNFLLVPFLLWVRSCGVPPGRIAVLFCVLYAGLRIPIDMLREYPTTFWGIPNGQMLNFFMVGVGVIALVINIYRPRAERPVEPQPEKPLWWRKLALAAICIIPLVIPSDATRDVPATYGTRHVGMEHSWRYPDIADALKAAEDEKEGRR